MLLIRQFLNFLHIDKRFVLCYTLVMMQGNFDLVKVTGLHFAEGRSDAIELKEHTRSDTDCANGEGPILLPLFLNIWMRPLVYEV